MFWDYECILSYLFDDYGLLYSLLSGLIVVSFGIIDVYNVVGVLLINLDGYVS